MDIQERFWSKVNKQTDSGCWEWTGEKSEKEYGRFTFWIAPKKYKRVYAHRFAWEQMYGLVPYGLQLDHLCRGRSCVNPDHLEVVTSRENNLRGMSPSAITYRTGVCKRGHALTDDNIHICSNGYRTCLTCLHAGEKRWREANRETLNEKQRKKTAARPGRRNEYYRQRRIAIKNSKSAVEGIEHETTT